MTLTESQKTIYLEVLKNSGRLNYQGKVTPTDVELILLAQLSKRSTFFKGLLEQYGQYGSLFPKAFVYFMDAQIEEEKRIAAQVASDSLASLPKAGETVSLPISIATIKEVKWEAKTQYFEHVHTETRSNIGIIGYVGETEVFFWGASQRIQRAHLEEGKKYLIAGIVKESSTDGNKMEINRISAITPL